MINQKNLKNLLIFMFIFQSCDINENQLMVAKELDFIVKNEPKEDEDWYVTEVVNVCSDCAEKKCLDR